MQIINQQLLDQVSGQAQNHLRLRMNYNFHDSAEANVQKLLNALDPGTQLPIFRHRLHRRNLCVASWKNQGDVLR